MIKKVLITRHSIKDKICSRLKDSGFDFLHMPLFRVEYRDEILDCAWPFKQSQSDILADTIIILTSVNSIKYAKKFSLYCTLFFVVGRQTAVALKGELSNAAVRYFINVESMLLYIKRYATEMKNILYLRGHIVSINIAKTLNNLGINVVEYIVYKMIPIEYAPTEIVNLISDSYVMLYSTEGAKRFKQLIRAISFEQNALEARLGFICISKKVANVFQKPMQNWSIFTSQNENEESMLDLLLALPQI